MEKLVAFLQNAPATRPYIVAINGIDASGKSYLADFLAKELRKVGRPAELIHVDDFHLPRTKRAECTMSPPECYYRATFDWGRLEHEVLLPIATNHDLDKAMPVLNLATDTFDTIRHYQVKSDSVVLVEGVFLFTSRLLRYFDFKVFIDIDDTECLRRVTKRDGYLFGDSNTITKRYNEKYLPGQRLYIEECNPRGVADLVINNSMLGSPSFTWAAR